MVERGSFGSPFLFVLNHGIMFFCVAELSMKILETMNELKHRLMLRSANYETLAETNKKHGDFELSEYQRGESDGYKAAANLLGRYLLRLEQENIHEILGFSPPPSNLGCTIPPNGWWCSREPGHTGPCAAWPNSVSRHND